jgi:hypothetical protein
MLRPKIEGYGGLCISLVPFPKQSKNNKEKHGTTVANFTSNSIAQNHDLCCSYLAFNIPNMTDFVFEERCYVNASVSIDNVIALVPRSNRTNANSANAMEYAA